jgi:hypothetical protein
MELSLFLRSHQSLSYPRSSQQFTQPEGSITVFTRAFHWSPSWVILIRSILLHPIFLKPILVLYFHLRLGLPSALFPSGFYTKILYAFVFSPIRATVPALLVLLDCIILIIFREECASYEPPIISLRFGRNILLSTLFWNTLSLSSSLNVRDPSLTPIQNYR